VGQVRFRFVLGSFPVRFYCDCVFSTTSTLSFPVRFAVFPVRFLAMAFIFNNFLGSFLKIKKFLSHFLAFNLPALL